MLCRVLFTIITISCTFSRETIVKANDQRIVQIKDLICVLLLSGLQKEDLNLNTLNKLQRHNVNIDDMKNENLRDDCISRSTNLPKTDIKDEETKPNKSIQEQPKPELNTIIRYFNNLKSDDQTVTGVIEESTTKFVNTENYSTQQINYLKSNLDETVTYKNPNTEKNYLELYSTDRIEKPDLQNFIKLWVMYNKEGNVKTENLTSKLGNSETYTSRPNALKLSDNEQETKTAYNINKMIADYIPKNKINPTTTLPTSLYTQNIDYKEISQQMERYLAANNDYKQLRNMDEIIKSRNVPFHLLNLSSKGIQTEANMKMLHKDQINNSLKESVKDKAKKYLEEMFSKNEHFEPNERRHTREPYVFSQTRKLDENNNHNVEIPLDMLKQIAESVKAIVLKDLKKDTLTLTTEAITVKTTETEKSTPKQGTYPKDVNNVMEKFMELFQQFKIIKEKTVASGDETFKTTVKQSVHGQFNSPLQLGYPPSLPAINPYGAIMPVAQITPIFPNPYNQSSYLNTPFIHDNKKSNNLKSIQKITQVNIFHHKNEPQPLTIQTNSYEIPPLGIPISKSMNAINQNIIVTTKSPFLRPKIDRQHGSITHYELEDKTNIKDWFNKHGLSNINRQSNRARFNTNSRERQLFDNEYDHTQYRSGKVKPDYSKSDYERNNNIKRFHERLERPDDSPMDEDDNCCNIKVASRQQRPIGNLKNRLQYDDTHFTNFLKTQEKVNDMLERILATKTRDDGPRSVETP